MATAAWVEQARDAPVKDVALELGIKKAGRGGLGPCPLCDAATRSSSDKRGPVLTQGKGWKCVACDATGDAVNMVAFAKFKQPLKGCSRDQSDEVRRWFEERKWCAPMDEADKRIPEGELREFWGATRPVSEADEEVFSFFRRRGWHHGAVSGLGFVRITPTREQLQVWPAWWPSSRAESWRVIVPAFMADGSLASVHARAVEAELQKGKPKTLWPKGFSSSGLIMADREGLLMMRGKSKPSVLIVCEGITDLISTSIAKVRSKRGAANIAVLSCTSGGFKALKEVRTPDGITVLAATDAGDKDGTGDEYAKEIAGAFYGRHDVKRIPLVRG